MEGRSISEDENGEWAQLDWGSPGPNAFIAAGLAIASLTFLYWAFRPSAPGGDYPYGSRGPSIFDVLDMLRIGWFGWADLLVAGLLGWFATLCGRRAADPVALVVSSEGLRLHPTLGGGTIPWGDISHVKLSLDQGYAGIELGFIEPRRLGLAFREVNHVLTGLDMGGGLAEDFVDTAARLQQAAEARDGAL